MRERMIQDNKAAITEMITVFSKFTQ